jgi:hypothetical protein
MWRCRRVRVEREEGGSRYILPGPGAQLCCIRFWLSQYYQIQELFVVLTALAASGHLAYDALSFVPILLNSTKV